MQDYQPQAYKIKEVVSVIEDIAKAMGIGTALITDDGRFEIEVEDSTAVEISPSASCNSVFVRAVPFEPVPDIDIAELLTSNEHLSEFGGPFVGYDPRKQEYYSYIPVPVDHHQNGRAKTSVHVVDAIKECLIILKNIEREYSQGGAALQADSEEFQPQTNHFV